MNDGTKSVFDDPRVLRDLLNHQSVENERLKRELRELQGQCRRQKMTPMKAHQANIGRLKALRDKVKARFSSAKITFSLVPWGWQCDIEIVPEGGDVSTDAVCKDWEDSDKSAKAFLERLIDMAETGKVDPTKKRSK